MVELDKRLEPNQLIFHQIQVDGKGVPNGVFKDLAIDPPASIIATGLNYSSQPYELHLFPDPCNVGVRGSLSIVPVYGIVSFGYQCTHSLQLANLYGFRGLSGIIHYGGEDPTPQETLLYPLTYLQVDHAFGQRLANKVQELAEKVFLSIASPNVTTPDAPVLPALDNFKTIGVETGLLWAFLFVSSVVAILSLINLGLQVSHQRDFDEISVESFDDQESATIRAFVKVLPEKVYTKAEPLTSPECCICIEEYEDQDKLKELPCGHLFHLDCIDVWLLGDDTKAKHLTCPLCKSELDPFGKDTIQMPRPGLVRSFFQRLIRGPHSGTP